MSFQKVILLGNVGRAPQVRYVDQRPIATFSLATTESYQPQGGGDPITRTEWHNLVMSDASAEFAEKYIRRGSRLFVEGRLRTRVWEDRTTIKHNITEIIVDRFELLSRS
jgi:single-strand DNA-binding protein